MFAPDPAPRVFALPPGVDFGAEVVAGLVDRCGDGPEALARVEVIVNTRRLQRRLRDCLDAGPARLHPRIRVLGDLALDPAADLPLPVPPLRRRLELMRLVRGLIAQQPDLAPDAAAFDLADGLARLFEEMHGEGVTPDDLRGIEVPDSSGHWQRALQFVDLVADYFARTGERTDAEGRLRAIALRLAARWATDPPDHPVILAGSTGSRGASALLMEAVARLPRGAVILPGFDTDLLAPVWQGMSDPATAEDHPQFRFRQVMDRLEIAADRIRPWTVTPPPCPARNALISLSLRPAPVTDQWLEEAPRLTDLAAACAGMTLVEAESRREEADTIALRLRKAVADGQKAALISPDRLLTRQVAAALDRWRIVPDDSAGVPLSLTPPGRLLLHLMDGMEGDLTAETLLTVLKHPLTASGGERGTHLLLTRELELRLRQTGVPFPGPADIRAWAEKAPDSRRAWAAWLCDVIADWPAGTDAAGLDLRLDHHAALAERIAAGPEGEGSGTLWHKATGRAARALLDDLRLHGDVAGPLAPADYAALLHRLLAGQEVREPDPGHPQVMIWGTLEARVQAADLVILGSMNDGTWPELPGADPWLNRQMRAQAGLLLPERRVGLSAHDYQMAVAAPEVWITRALRSDDAQTVPSRWVNRLTNLLGGLADTAPLADMRERGRAWLATARRLPEPGENVPRAGRPSPRPPVAARPKRLSVTEIEALTRDPFEIYAKKVLRLRPLHPLQREPDALLRGILVHEVMERFGRAGIDPQAPDAPARLTAITEEVLAADCPWPTARALWQGRLGRATPWFLATEVARRALATPAHFEATAETTLPEFDLTLVGRADRVDLTADGRAVLYDFKTGDPPSDRQQVHFNPQLLLLSAMAGRGGFTALGPVETAAAAYIGLGNNPREVPAPLSDHPPEAVWTQFMALLAAWRDPGRGYTARIANKEDQEDRDYDHLSRLGEWDVTDQPAPVVLT